MTSITEYLDYLLEKDRLAYVEAKNKFDLIDAQIKDEKEKAYRESLLLKTETKQLYVNELNELEQQEDNFSKLYGLKPEYKSSGGKHLSNLLLENKDIEVDTLLNALKTIQSRSQQLKEERDSFRGQESELRAIIQSDPDVFDPNEFNMFLDNKKSSLRVGKDLIEGTKDDLTEKQIERMITGYRVGYEDYTKNAINTLKLLAGQEEYAAGKGKPSQSNAMLALNRVALNSNTFSGFQKYMGQIQNLAIMRNNNPEEYMHDVNYQSLEKDNENLQIKIGLEYASLFNDSNKVGKIINNADKITSDPESEFSKTALQLSNKYFEQFYNIHAAASGKAEAHKGVTANPDYDRFFFDVRDSYNYYLTLNDKDKGKHEILSAKYFGYDARRMDFPKFFEVISKQYSTYIMDPLFDDGIIIPDDDDDDPDKNKKNKYNKY